MTPSRGKAVFNRRSLFIALLAVGPATAGAQFTTFIPPKPKVQDSIKAAVASGQVARSDSVARASITNLKTWVDSASGVTTPVMTAADSARLANATVVADTATTFRNGARAPSTASDLPLMAGLGGLLVMLGLLIRARSPRERSV